VRVRCTTLFLELWLGVRLYTLVAPGRRRAMRFWCMVEGRILRVMGYVFFSPQGKGHGTAVYYSFDLEAVAKSVV